MQPPTCIVLPPLPQVLHTMGAASVLPSGDVEVDAVMAGTMQLKFYFQPDAGVASMAVLNIGSAADGVSGLRGRRYSVASSHAVVGFTTALRVLPFVPADGVNVLWEQVRQGECHHGRGAPPAGRFFAGGQRHCACTRRQQRRRRWRDERCGHAPSASCLGRCRAGPCGAAPAAGVAMPCEQAAIRCRTSIPYLPRPLKLF